jgi:predicted Zn-dependent protease
MATPMMHFWKLDQLKAQLSKRKEVKAWIITQEHAHRRERYFLLDRDGLGLDQDRDTSTQNIQVRLFVRLSDHGRQGEITKKFFVSRSLEEQLDQAIKAALQTDHKTWELPTELHAKLPQLSTTDSRMAEDLEGVMSELTNQISAAVVKKRATVFNSAELFLSIHDRELHLSTGLIHRSSQSRIYAEAAYSINSKSIGGEPISDEYLNTQWAVSLDDISTDKLFDETSGRVEHLLDVKKPETGRYSVIVDKEVLALLFNDMLTQLSAANAYNQLPFIKPGSELIAGASEDLISLWLDPMLEFGADTASLSEQGVLQRQIKLVDQNRVIATSADKQYADYLGIPAGTSRGDVVVQPGSLSYDELTKYAPKVIEILQFSGLFADPNSGTFSSEIRLAKLYDNVTGTVQYLKGGALSGAVTDNFKGVRFSNQQVKHAHFESGGARGRGYLGPGHALLTNVSIVG